MGGGYNRNGVKLSMAEIQKGHGQAAVDQRVNALNLDAVFGFKAAEAIIV